MSRAELQTPSAIIVIVFGFEFFDGGFDYVMIIVRCVSKSNSDHRFCLRQQIKSMAMMRKVDREDRMV
jgi:hypothetical protein